MPSKRSGIPKQVRGAVLAEYSHRCAVCGGDHPHVHHINEDPSDNEPLNLLPLCPNCHLRDQHNPTRGIDIPKLQLFRLHKDPAILKAGFHPIYLRQLFLDGVAPGDAPTGEIESQAEELMEFVQALEMGEFYSKQLKLLLDPPFRPRIYSIGGHNPSHEPQEREENRGYRAKVIAGREKVKELLVELLRYQAWAHVT